MALSMLKKKSYLIEEGIVERQWNLIRIKKQIILNDHK